MLNIIFLILALLLAVVATIFAAQNPIIVDVKFLNIEWQESLAILMIFSFGAGIITGTLALLPRMLINRAKMASRERRIKKLANTVEDDA